ncbi:MAG: putative DNA binding domain-containing protein [Firmicutes bacterium]|nr:putative DNA binding domain-containing protein [Bacillota bacterium]
MRESNRLEWKETVTNTFLKTVSAFSNYNGGNIVFGIDDQGNIKGIDDFEEARLNIENKINDSISPQPRYTISVQEKERTITVHVEAGENKPYYYKSKAYKRNDTATIEVDALEHTRLILEGKHISFESLTADNQNLTFEVLERYLKKNVHIQKLNKDILKTLNLYSDASGYNHTAEIVADQNRFPGIDIVKFGADINIMQKRATFSNQSVLKSYEEAMGIFEDYYTFEEIIGAERKRIEKIPKEAFREAVANAIIHRTWDVNAQIRIMMCNDRIEVISPGGLPMGISEEEYLSGRISMLRNQSLAHLFYRLNIVEIFGTGILRIKQMYADSVSKPRFEVTEHTISVILPIVDTQDNLTKDEKVIYRVLSSTMAKSVSEITSNVEFGRSKVTSLLKTMAEKGCVVIEGNGRGTKYRK